MRRALNARYVSNRLNAKRKHKPFERPIKREFQLKDKRRYESILLDDDYDPLDYMD